MANILREAVIWLLGFLQKRLDPELRKRVEDDLDKARRLKATNVAAKKDLARLENEFGQLKQRRDELHAEIALVEMEIEQFNSQAMKV